MTESLREMASAFVDGETSEIECRRILREAGPAQLRGLIHRHYVVRAVLRQECAQICPSELSGRIFAALDAETNVPVRNYGARWLRPLAGVAVAASVCVAVVIGNQLPGTTDSSQLAAAGPIVVRGASLPALGAPAMQQGMVAGAAVPVGFGSAVSRNPNVAISDEANLLAAQRLQRFMLEHAENAALNSNQGMMPFARVARYDLP